MPGSASGGAGETPHGGPSYRTADFDYAYPESLIAQTPSERRDASRLLHLSRDGTLTHRRFTDLPTLMTRGDVLVVNASRVIKARLEARRDNGRPAEILLVHAEADGTWLAMVHPGGKLKAGRTVTLGDATIEVTAVLGGGLRRLRIEGSTWDEAVDAHGTVPLPPYIARPAEAADTERYQTVYAKEPGSVAAPTAGLHFTPQVLAAIRAKGVDVAEIVLHVGPGTFKPVASDDPGEHQMHREWFSVSAATADALRAARGRGGRVWAVGTTVTRVLETVGPEPDPTEGWTDLYIRPGFTFRTVDALLTNFHLPRSTLLMLVCAFGGYDDVMRAYRTAVDDGYRLYSYGDCMVIA